MKIRITSVLSIFCILAATAAAEKLPVTSLAATPGSADSFRFPATGIAVEKDALLLAIDDVSLPFKKNLCYYLSKPTVRKEPVLTPSLDKPDAPDSLAANFYGTVLHDGGKFRMWYYGARRGLNPDWPPDQQAVEKQFAQRQHGQNNKVLEGFLPGPLCYAESSDGISWTKPSLGLMSFKGSKDHNALNLPEAVTAQFLIIKDEAEPNPDRRYKLVYEYIDKDSKGKIYASMRTAVSPDGLRWKVGSKMPIDAFVEFSGFYHHQGLYIINAHSDGGTVHDHPGEGGSNRGRHGIVWVSTDFDNWLQESAESFSLPEPQRPEDRGAHKPYDQVHLGTGAASFGNVLVGLYGIWHNDTDWPKISCDFGLVVSNDGIKFREPVKGHVYLAFGESLVSQPLDESHPEMLFQANGILNVGDETRIYHGRHRGKDFYSEVALATLPRDRWGALGLNPNATEGNVWSTPITLPPNCQVFLNADGVRGMRVEVADERFRLLPQYSGENSGACPATDGLDCPIKWPTGGLAALAGKTVRLRVHLKQGEHPNPRLYAINLKNVATTQP